MLDLLRKLEAAVNAIATAISGAAFVGVVLLISTNVVSRYLFRVSFAWAEEISYLLFNWTVFFGITVLYRREGLIAIDVLVDKLPERIRRPIMILNYLLVLAICVGLVYWGYAFSVLAWNRKSAYLRIPYFYYDISIPLAFAILAAYALKFLILTLAGRKGGTSAAGGQPSASEAT